MNILPPSENSDAEEQAALWAARLEGDSLDAAGHAALDAWLAENPVHRALLTQYCQFSADLEEQLPALLAVGAVTLPPEKTSARRPFPKKFFRPAFIALAAAAALAFIFWFARSTPEKIATAAGQRQSFTLADGTRVELNARTRLQIESGRTERRVRLVEGEAFFTVSKDKTRPFIVETPGGAVRVTGTVFDVRCEVPSEFEVTVVEGSVQASPAEASEPRSTAVPLTAGDRLSARDHKVFVQTLSSETLEAALAWRQGQIVFLRTPLHEALARFAHYHGRTLTTTAAAADQTIGGRYNLDDLDGFLAGLEEALPVRATRGLNGSVEVRLRSER